MVDEAFFQSHPKLFHYTSVDAFRNILKTQTLWASHYKTLNDKSELTHFENFISDGIGKILPELKRHFPGNYLTTDNEEIKRELVRILYSDPVIQRNWRKHFDPYITSFCTHEYPDQGEMNYVRENGLLSQWISYGGTAGCMIVFDTRKINALLNQESEEYLINTDIFKVVYMKNTDVKIDEFPEFYNILLKMCKSTIKQDIDKETFRRFLYESVNIKERLKHVAFSAENEVRMSVSLFNDNKTIREIDPDGTKIQKEVCYRMKGNIPVPYITLFGAPKKLPIEKVIVGPNLEQQRIVDAIQSMCEPSGIEVTCSSTPYITSQ